MLTHIDDVLVGQRLVGLAVLGVFQQHLIHVRGSVLVKLIGWAEYDEGYLALAQDAQFISFLHHPKLAFVEGDLSVPLVGDSGDLDFFSAHLDGQFSSKDGLQRRCLQVRLGWGRIIRLRDIKDEPDAVWLYKLLDGFFAAKTPPAHLVEGWSVLHLILTWKWNKFAHIKKVPIRRAKAILWSFIHDYQFEGHLFRKVLLKDIW